MDTPVTRAVCQGPVSIAPGADPTLTSSSPTVPSRELREASELEMKRERAEAIRVAYVAATGARDVLVVPACGDGPTEGWFEVPVRKGCSSSRLCRLGIYDLVALPLSEAGSFFQSSSTPS
jgi:hypothetical protein